jgi:peptide deformylase
MLYHQKNAHSGNIIEIGDPILEKKSESVSDIGSAEMQDLVTRMYEIMKTENGVGLAAPQINISKQVAVIDLDGQQYTLINPKIITRSPEMILFTEGCLSVPNQELPIIRHQKITVQYIDANGMKNKLKANALLAVVCQHEIDHLNGILITDRYAQQKAIREEINIS